MVVDSSILVAVILKEEGYQELVFKMASADVRLLSAASYLESSIVLLRRRGPGAEVELDRLIEVLEIVIVAFDADAARIARQAFVHFGKGRHPAGLNFGDCFVYALARVKGEPVFFLGGDFSQTDLEVV